MYPSDTEPWEPNLTTLKDFQSKWSDLLPAGTPVPTPPVTDPKKVYTQVGVYEAEVTVRRECTVPPWSAA